MYWEHYSRERAAQDIVSIAHRLSHEAWVFRPIDLQVKQQAIEDLKTVHEELLKLGYTYDSSSLVIISSALSTLSSIPHDALLPYSTALRVAQILLPAVEALSRSASLFPVPNRHLPIELLHRIYDYVIDDYLKPHEDETDDDWDDYSADPTPPELQRQETILNLSATSIAWRQVVLERPIVYLDSFKKLENYSSLREGWLESGSPRGRQPCEELHLDLTALKTHEAREWRANGYSLIISGLGKENPSRKLIMTMKTDDETPLADPNFDGHGWAQEAREWGKEGKCSSLRLKHLSKEEYRDVWRVLQRGKMEDETEREYFIGDQNQAVELTTRITQAILDCAGYLEGNDWYDAGKESPIFTDYTVFAAPWLVFTAPLFLLETVSRKYKPASLLPSRLRHLELSFQLDPTNPARAIQELEAFFSKIAPRIERLAFRLRITDPHPSLASESTFTEHLVSCLLSCRRLQHLEIGGFGFSPDFLSRLTTLPLSNLVILPQQHVESCKDLIALVKSDSSLRNSLKTLFVRLSVIRGSEHRRDSQKLEKLCQAANIQFKVAESREQTMLRRLIEFAGVE
ncbi:hypothetical protein JCM5350_004744 [Sporobolomyces pararoseus]